MSWRLRLCWLLALVSAACTNETWVPATQVIVTVHSDDSALKSVEASIYDVLGEQRGGHYVFRLDEELSLPLSFTVIPGRADTDQFLVVLSGRDESDRELVQTRAIIKFVRQNSVGVHLWLYAGCQGRTCAEGETCTISGELEMPGCTSIPMIEGEPVTPGKELLDAGTDETGDASATDGSTADVATMEADTRDASTDFASDAATSPDAAAEDAASQPDASLDGPCVGSAGQPVCVANVLQRCDAQGKPTTQDSCASPRACQLGLAKSLCATCEPGVFRCQGARLDRCAEDGFTWSEFKTCDSEALCNVQAGDCTTGACTASTRTCMGDDLFGCSDDLTKLVLRSECDPGMCDPAQGQCDVCVANSKSCASDSVVACDKDGQNLGTTPCPSGTPKCTGSGQCVQCTAPSHCTVPGNPCQTATCSGSPPRCGVSNKSAHQRCTGGVCNGNGACIGCVDNTDCTQGYECRVSDHTCQRKSVAGMSAGCNSYTAPTSSKCGGYYCNLTPQQLDAAYDPLAVCGGISSSLLCSVRLNLDAGRCFRQVKSANIVASNAELRPKVEECVRKLDLAYSSISSQCMGCYADVHACAMDKCLIECLSEDNVDCDKCRIKNNCDQPLPGCGGLPNTF